MYNSSFKYQLLFSFQKPEVSRDTRQSKCRPDCVNSFCSPSCRQPYCATHSHLADRCTRSPWSPQELPKYRARFGHHSTLPTRWPLGDSANVVLRAAISRTVSLVQSQVMMTRRQIQGSFLLDGASVALQAARTVSIGVGFIYRCISYHVQSQVLWSNPTLDGANGALRATSSRTVSIAVGCIYEVRWLSSSINRWWCLERGEGRFKVLQRHDAGRRGQ